MKTKRMLTIATMLAALTALMTLGIIRAARPVKAQNEQPPPHHDRISFGMVGITQGQTIRLSVVNTEPSPQHDSQSQIFRVVMTFLDAEGHRLRGRDSSIIRRAVSLAPGRAIFLDLNADDIQWPPGPTRVQVRAVVNVTPPDGTVEEPPPVADRLVPSVEVFNNANGRTVIFIGNPGVIRGFNPQPDPPL
jgi:hypothetical protein